MEIRDLDLDSLGSILAIWPTCNEYCKDLKMFVVRRLLRLFKRRRDVEDETLKSAAVEVTLLDGDVTVTKSPTPSYIRRTRSDSFLVTDAAGSTGFGPGPDIMAEVKQAEIKRVLEEFGLLTETESDDLSWTKTEFGHCFYDFLRLDIFSDTYGTHSLF